MGGVWEYGGAVDFGTAAFGEDAELHVQSRSSAGLIELSEVEGPASSIFLNSVNTRALRSDLGPFFRGG